MDANIFTNTTIKLLLPDKIRDARAVRPYHMTAQQNKKALDISIWALWRGGDLNSRPQGYESCALTN